MKIYSVRDEEFRPYGKVLEGYDTAALREAMERIDMPSAGTSYRASIPELEETDVFPLLEQNAFGGMPIELGMCWGHNTKLNCLEYHRDSEINVGTTDFILLLAKLEEIVDGKLSTDKVKAFRIGAGDVVEVYATTLHFAPCSAEGIDGFRVAVVLPKGTNTEIERPSNPLNIEDQMLWKRNKWLIAHEEAPQASLGAFVGLIGENLDISSR